MIATLRASVLLSTWSRLDLPTTLRTVVCAIWPTAPSTFSISMIDFTGSTRRKYATAATPMETLSSVMICCEAIGIVTVRRLTFHIRSASGTMKRSRAPERS